MSQIPRARRVPANQKDASASPIEGGVLVLLGATSSAMAASWQDIVADYKKAAAGPGGITRVDIAFAAGLCMGIVEGALWSLPRTDFRLPNDATTGQGLKVLVKYTDDHPEELHERTALLAAGAFVKAWRARMTQRNPLSTQQPKTNPEASLTQQTAFEE